MAHIRKLDGGRWQARYRDTDRKERAHNFRTKAEAQRWIDEQTADLVRGDWRDPRSGRMTVGDLAETWYATTAALKPSTRLSYRSLLDRWIVPRWGAAEVRRLQHGAIAAWAAEVTAEASASTTRKVLGVLRGILELAVRDRRIPANPALRVSLPALPLAKQRFLTAEELGALADSMPTERDRILTLLLGWTGLRFGEAAALRVASIDILRRRIHVTEAVAEVRGQVILGTPKTHAARSIALPGFLSPILARYLGSVPRSGLAFPDAAGGPIRVTNWNRRTFTPTAIEVGLVPPKLRVHDLRHTAASLMIASGAGVKLVQQQLGHRTATLTLDRYAHLFPDELDALSGALDELKARTPADSLRTVPGATDVARIEDAR
jgi:integrase